MALNKTLPALKLALIFSAFIVLVLIVGKFSISKGAPTHAAEQPANEPAQSPTKNEIIASKEQGTKPLPITQTKNTIQLPILMYHHVGPMPELTKPDPLRTGLTVSIAHFEEQMVWLSKQGYHSVTLEDIYQYTKKGQKLPTKPIAITFDDGYDDVFQNAIPILKKYSFTGSFGIITQWPGQQQGTNTYATWPTIQQAQKAGMEIICHTQNHFDGSNPKFSAQYIYQNLTGCQQDLGSNLNLTHNHILIYPYGHYSSVYIDQAKKAGFDMALTVHFGTTLQLNSLMEMPRVRVNGRESLEKFIELLSR